MSGYSVPGALGSYGYDMFSDPYDYNEEINYTPKINKPSLEERINAKRNALNAQRNANSNANSNKNSSLESEEVRKVKKQCDCCPHKSSDRLEQTNKEDDVIFKIRKNDIYIMFVIFIIYVLCYALSYIRLAYTQLVNLTNTPPAGLNPIVLNS